MVVANAVRGFVLFGLLVLLAHFALVRHLASTEPSPFVDLGPKPAEGGGPAPSVAGLPLGQGSEPAPPESFESSPDLDAFFRAKASDAAAESTRAVASAARRKDPPSVVATTAAPAPMGEFAPEEPAEGGIQAFTGASGAWAPF